MCPPGLKCCHKGRGKKFTIVRCAPNAEQEYLAVVGTVRHPRTPWPKECGGGERQSHNFGGIVKGSKITILSRSGRKKNAKAKSALEGPESPIPHKT